MIRFLTVSLLAAAGLCCQEAAKPEPGTKPAPAAPVQAGRGNAWFPEVDKDLGTYFHHEEAKGVFQFKNPTDQPQTIRRLEGSCTCSKAIFRLGEDTYEMTSKPVAIFKVAKSEKGESREPVKEIPVGPNQEGEVEIHMEMNGVTGVRSATLDVHLTDPNLPLVKLRFQATGAQMFVVTPAEVNLNTMTWNEVREFTVQVASPVLKEFNITRMEDAGKDFKVHYEKSDRGGAAVWTITGTYGPVTAESGGGGVLKFYTDQPNAANFAVRVLAFVKGPLEIKPGGFLTLGLIRKGTPRTEKVVFEPNDDSDLQAVDVAFEKLSVPKEFITYRAVRDGKKLVVELVIDKSTPTGLLRGDMVVKLNHKAVPEKRILFNGFVR